MSLTCRYSGQCKHFYSVTQHCLNIQNDLKNFGYDEEIQLHGLLHDASEAYICDLPTPIKAQLHEYKIYEKMIEVAILEKFDLKLNEKIHKIIKESDVNVFYNKFKLLMNNLSWMD